MHVVPGSAARVIAGGMEVHWIQIFVVCNPDGIYWNLWLWSEIDQPPQSTPNDFRYRGLISVHSIAVEFIWMFCLSVAFYEVPIIYAIRLLRTDLLLASCILVACTHILRYLSTIVYTFWILVDNIKCVCNSAWRSMIQKFRSIKCKQE